MEKRLNVINAKNITIYTIVILVLSMLVFEIGYCNSTWLISLITKNVQVYVYHISFCRILVYIAIIIIYCIFKNGFIREALEVSNNKYKRILIYCAIVAVIIMLIFAIMKLRTNLFLIKDVSIKLITAFLASLTIIYLSNNQIKNVIVVTATLGIVFSFSTHYNHAIDEKKHFMSALNLSFLNFDYADNPITDTKIEELRHLTKYDQLDDKFFEKYTPNITNEVNKEDGPSTPANYPFISYVFPAIGITIARLLGGSIIDMYILGRIMNLILYTILICFTIKILPYKKNIFIILAMLPYMLLLATSYSIDGYCIGVIFLFIAYCLKVAKEEETISLKNILILMALFLLVLLAKSMSYIAVGLVVFILPLAKTLKKNKKYLPKIIAITLLLVVLVTAVLIKIKNNNMKEDSRASGEINIEKQLNILLTSPRHDIELIVEHIKATLLNFNWLVNLHQSTFFTENAPYVMLLLMIFILYVSLTETDEILKIKEKIVMVISFFVVFRNG